MKSGPIGKDKIKPRLKKRVPCAMTIAGSDSGGGAGIEADLKTFAALGVFGTCVVTAVTAQNTLGVYEVFPLPPEIVERQINTVLEDIQIETVKTGMLYSEEIMRVVSEAIDKYGFNAVVDPVFRAGTGNLLIRERDVDALIDLMIPRALVLTPNIPEAERIIGARIKNVDDMKEAARSIAGMGSSAVVVKGGHLQGRTVYDVLYYEGVSKMFKKPRIEIKTHGGGCTFSAAIASYLTLGEGVLEAVKKAERVMKEAIEFSLKVGGGRTPVNPMAHLHNEAEKFHVLKNVSKAAEFIEIHPAFLPYIAEVGTQVAMALPYASDSRHIVAIEGRIVKFREGAKAVGSAKFGASKHLAQIILTTMRYNPEMRAALNLHYDLKLVEAFKKAGYQISSFRRETEPEEIKSVEGRTLTWGVEEAIKIHGSIPDIIYDLGELGKEPMIRILGTSATTTVRKALNAIKFLIKKKG